MKIISISHVYVEEEILDPYRRICSTVILFDVDRLKVLGKLVLHDLIDEAHGVCGTSVSVRAMTDFV
jgi:hypothetical protein